ncbi:PAS domain-containing protein [Azospirillum sp. sgz302134]
MSLLHRLLLLVFLSLVPAAVIEVKNELALRQTREDEVRQSALRLAALVEAQQDRMVDGLHQLLNTLAVTDAIRGPDPAACQTMMDELHASYPDYLRVNVVDPAGGVRCSTDRAAIGRSIADRPHVREALASGRFVVGEHIRQRSNGREALPVALSYRDPAGRIAGVVTALTDIAWIDRFLADKPLPPSARVTVVDRRNVVIAQVPPIPGMAGTPLPPDLGKLMERDDPGVIEAAAFEGQPRIIAYRPTKVGLDGVGVMVSLDMQEALGPIHDAMVRALTGIAAILVATLAAAWWGGHRLLRRPTAALVHAAQRWSEGTLAVRSGVAGERSEIGTLARAFDSMAEELERRHRAAEEANALAHKMAAVLASTTDGVFEVDRDWRITFMNDRARMLIANGRDLMGQCLWDAFPQAVGTIFSDRYRHAMDEQEPVEFEGLYPPLDAWYAVRAFPSRDGLAIFFQDITARKRGEEALVFANREKDALLAQLNGLLENAPVGLAFFDRAHRYIRINEKLADINGIPPEAHIGRTIEELLPVNAVSVDPMIDSVFQSGRSLSYQEIVGETPSQLGVRRHWLTAFFPVHDGPDVVAVGAVVMEVTDLRRAEAARTQSEERFRSVFEMAAVGIERLALDGRFLDVNAKLCSILGYRREELLGRGYRDITDPDDQPAEEALLDRLLGGDIPSYAIEKRYRRKDGRPVWVRVTSSLARITGTEMAYRISIVEDITERKAMEEELRFAKDEAERANLAKSKFLAAASHDLRQPLQSLFFFAAALAGHIENGAGIQVLRHLEQGLDTLKGLLDSLLDVSRLDAGVVTPVIEDFDVAEVLDPIRTAYAPVASEKGLGWSVESCSAKVRSDRTLLPRMLRNLVENAVRYTESGLVRVQCRVEGRSVSIVVQDTGIGIPAGHLERIFEEFHQVGNPERDRTQGLGLGLAIVRRLSRLLEHPVEVRSVEGRGSAFRVLVPLGEAEPSEAVEGVKTAPGKGHGRFAVLVDDDAIVLMGLQMILAEWGYTVLSAGSADQAMERLEAQDESPDIVIADYRLREGRVGTEVILRVRERYGAAVPGVILTGETGPDCLHDAAAHGLTVIHKPVTPRELGAAVDQQLRAGVE